MGCRILSPGSNNRPIDICEDVITYWYHCKRLAQFRRHFGARQLKRTIPPDWHLRSRLKARQLALLVAIAEHRSLRQAAQHIAVTQPAATRMLKELEDALGVPLFDRFAWGMQPTTYGDTMIRYARGVLTDLSEARDEIAALASGAKGKLRIGSVTGAVPGLVAPALQSVRQGRPGLKVFVLVNTSDVLAAALRQGTLDVAIGQVPADAERGEFDAEPLRDEPLMPGGARRSPAHPRHDVQSRLRSPAQRGSCIRPRARCAPTSTRCWRAPG